MLPNPLWTPLKSIIVYNRRKIYLDNLIFRIHYTWTVIALVACSILVTSKLYIGDPINCMSSPDIKSIADQYCFIHSTFTRGKVEKGKWIYEPVKENEIHPGVLPAYKDSELTYHSYYQWVWIVLWIQAIFFYYPHWIWEKIEGGTVKMLVGDLNLPMLTEEKQEKQRKKIIGYFGPNRGFHFRYAFSHGCCEVLNVVNIFAQIYTTDYFLNYEFSKYGFRLLYLTQMRPYMREDALARIFPTVTACRIATGGVAFGRVQHDILCVLPINILNEKVYIFLWFWFWIVALVSVSGLIYRFLTTILPPFRVWLVHRKARYISKEVTSQIVSSFDYGDWFLIYKLSQNMNKVVFGDLLEDIFSSLGAKERRLSRIESPSKSEKPLLEVKISAPCESDYEQSSTYSTPQKLA